jgi:hypothetical protein
VRRFCGINELLSLRSDLPFKGGRNYLQGPDTYNWLAGLLAPLVGESTPLTLTFRRLTGRQLEIVPHAEFSADPRAVADFSIPGRKDSRFVLIETDEVPTRRIPYDEDAMIATCTVEDRSIVARGSVAGYTPIELCVAMTKALHLAALPQERRKWLFARLELSRLLRSNDCNGLKIEIVRRVETRFTKSAIFTGDEPLGHIYFSVLAQ